MPVACCVPLGCVGYILIPKAPVLVRAFVDEVPSDTLDLVADLTDMSRELPRV